jgi:hypothetical protein
MAEAETSLETPRKRQLWPKALLWLLVIGFGIFYLDAVNERDPDGDAMRGVDRPASAPAQAPTEPTPPTPETAAGPRTAGREAPAGPIEPRIGGAPEPGTPPVALREAPAPQPIGGAASTAPDAAPDPNTQPASPTDQGPTAAAPPDRDPLAEHRARVLAEYRAMLESVEAERRALWEQMNQVPGNPEWPYPYPPPAPFGPPGYGWPPR